jgi:hypothetical protein
METEMDANENDYTMSYEDSMAGMLDEARARARQLRAEQVELRAKCEDLEVWRAELRDKLADSEDVYTLLVQAIRREFDDIMTFAGEYGLQDDSPVVVTYGALRRIYATDEVFDDTTVQDAIAEARAMRVNGREEG